MKELIERMLYMDKVAAVRSDSRFNCVNRKIFLKNLFTFTL